MRWVVRYQKGSFALQEKFDCTQTTTARVMALASDDAVWCIEVQDQMTGKSRLVTLGSGPSPLRAMDGLATSES